MSEKSVSQYRPYPRVGPPALLVAGRGERQLLLLLVGPQSIENGDFRVIHDVRVPRTGGRKRYGFNNLYVRRG